MKVETRQKTIIQNYNVYISKDGKEWPTEDACKLYEKRLDGTVKDCPDCHGEGRIRGRFVPEYDNYDIGHVDSHYEYSTCKTCGGKGYLEKVITWK